MSLVEALNQAVPPELERGFGGRGNRGGGTGQASGGAPQPGGPAASGPGAREPAAASSTGTLPPAQGTATTGQVVASAQDTSRQGLPAATGQANADRRGGANRQPGDGGGRTADGGGQAQGGQNAGGGNASGNAQRTPASGQTRAPRAQQPRPAGNPNSAAVTNATTIDALFAPLPIIETRGRAWLFINKQLKAVNLRLGISDGTVTEVLNDAELPADTDVVTTIVTPAMTAGTASPTNANNPLLPAQRGRGPGGNPGQSSGGRGGGR